MWIDRQDLLYTLRSARRAPLLSSIAIVALSLAIGLNAGVFTLLNTMFLTPPTQKDPASFVQLYPRYEGWFTGAGQFSQFTTEDYEAIRTRSKAIEQAAAWRPSSAILSQDAKHIAIALVSCNYFHVFGIDRPLLGRFLAPAECGRGATAQVAVLSEPFWRTRFGADPQIVGKAIHLNGLPFAVIGIAPSEDTNLLAGGVFVPYTLQPMLDRGNNLLGSPDSPWLDVAARLRQGYSRADAQAELTTMLRQQDRAYLENKVSPFNRKTSLVLTNGSFIQTPAIHDRVVAFLALILGPLSLVVLLACSNVTMLFLSRAIVRRGEIAVRLALGVGRARLLRMLVIESFLTALIAGAISVALAYRVPLLIMNAVDPNLSDIAFFMHPDWRVFGYLATLVAVATVVSSLAPMHAAWKLDLVTALKGREGSATMRSRTTSGLIVAQIAMSFVLMTAAVLFGRLPGAVTGMDPGFETRHTMAVPLEIDRSADNRTTALSFYRALETRLLAIPGVQSLAYESLQPFRQVPPSEIRLANQEKGQGKPASVDSVSTDFFSTFGIRLVAGRSFVPTDKTSAGASSVVLVSQAFAKQFWPDSDPLGKMIIGPEDKRSVVVGVAADIRSERFGVLDGPRLYTLRDPASLDGQMYLRFNGSANAMENAVKDAIRNLDATQVEVPQTIWESLEAQAEQLRSLARIVVLMASIAVLLAITGVYGVLSFAVNQRVREFGIRMVLGANRVSIFRSILFRGGRQIAIGLMCGLALAQPAVWALTQLSKNSPLPLRSVDVPVYAIAAALLVAVSLAAMYLPARRATQVDPMKALRTD
ncbi:MAG: ABC transporter permease [Terracidiphilus sp.]